MSDHAWILENLAAYLTGGLEPAERERLEQHMAECPPCTAALNDARAMDTGLSGLFAEARPNAALEDRVIRALRILQSLRPRRLPLPGWLAVAAAALVLVGLTGALANQLFLYEGAATPSAEGFQGKVAQGRFSSKTTVTGHTGITKDVAQLADESRRRMLSRLDDAKSDLDARREPREEEDESPPRKKSLSLYDRFDNSMHELRKENSAVKLRESLGRKPTVVGQEFRDSNKREAGAADRRSGVPGKPSSGPAADFGLPSRGFQPHDYLFFKQSGDGKEIKKQSLKDSLGYRANGQYMPQLGGMGAGVDAQVREKDRKPPPPPAAKGAEKPAGDKEQEQPGPRKIVIRTGQIEYEVPSFDAAVATIARLVKNIKGGYIATVNSDKLANGKVRGSVVVRVPPENLDELILDLRSNLGKTGELKNQRIGSQDITKQYTDLESELKAARAMEARLLEIIKTGKGQIKDLLAAEKELGNWRTRIEKIEGELRYFAAQVALSTLTITLYEKEITAPFAIIEREQVQMGIEVEEVDQTLQAAQKAVREAKGRITRAELKQPSQGQYSALLDFEVSPDAAGPLRDRLKQLGTVARFEISRLEETQGGAPPITNPTNGGGTKIKRNDTRFHVHFYNLTDVPPRETVVLSLACDNVETAMKTLLARVEKAAGRVLSSNLTSTRGTQTQGDLQFQVKTTLADAVLADIKSAGEVMSLQVREITNVETTRKKRGFQVKLWALEAAVARETDEMQLACTDVATSYRSVQEAVLKAKGRVRIAQLNEQDRRHVTATLDFEVRRADEEAVRAALLKAGAIYTRKVSRAADAENVVDSKVHWQITFINQANIPPRETYVFGVEVADVDQTAAMLSALAGKHQGRIIKADISRARSGQVVGELVYDVPMAEIRDLLDALKSSGTVRVQQSIKHPEVPDSALSIARLEITLSNAELIVPSDDGFGHNVRRGLSDSFAVLSWSLRVLILGLCVLLPWALVIWGIYRMVLRLRRRSTPASPAV